MGLLPLLHFAAGAALVAAALLIPRHIAKARLSSLPAVLLDITPLLLGAALLLLATGRPLFAGVIILAAGAGFALADDTMRDTLHEPVVFSEAVELPQVFTHPQLYLPFAGPALVIGGALGALLGALALLFLEPPLWPPEFLEALGFTGLLIAIGIAGAYQPLLGAAAAVLRRLRPSGEPFSDAEKLGPFGSMMVHVVIARDERPARRQAIGRPAIGAPAIMRERGEAAGGPIVLVQCESFFDARRLSPVIPGDLLSGLDACCAEAASFGRLQVPGWGANTMRAEFAALTGVAESRLGYDRFNPYYALARVPLESQVWRLRRAGYRTICLHPFDRRFFRRDLAMPALGFERFLCRETLGGSSAPPYRSDPELATDILKVLDAEGPHTFIFAITMGNHGPWLAKEPPIDPAVAALFNPTQVPNGAELQRYLDGLRRSDEMLRILRAGLEKRGAPAVLGFYGDHLPSLPRAFTHFGFDEPHSDYVIWDAATAHDVPPHRLDMPADRLGRTVIDRALGRRLTAVSN